MAVLLEAAFNQKLEELASDEFEIKASLDVIDSSGNTFI